VTSQVATLGDRARLLGLQDLALAEAQDFLATVEVGGDNRGPAVELFQKLGGDTVGEAWCADFVNAVVQIATGKKNERSPLEAIRRQAYVQDYVDWANREGRIIPAHHAEPGDLFALLFPSKGRYAHIGFVFDPPRDGQFSTIEGNTDDEASREGIKVASRVRDVTDGTVFFTWAREARS